MSPNLAIFNQREAIALGQTPEITFYAVTYGFGYAACILAISAIVFNNRNFK